MKFIIIPILIEIILSITNTNLTKPQSMEIDNTLNNNILKANNKCQNKISKFNELMHYVEMVNQEEIEMIINDTNNEEKRKKFLSLINEIKFLLNEIKSNYEFYEKEKIGNSLHIISKIKNLLENKTNIIEETINNKNHLKNESYIKNENEENEKIEENENIKDCVEYGLSPYDENYIICTKYE